MKKEVSSRLTSAQRSELASLATLPDEKIDTKDIPEVRNWAGAERGVFFRPIKRQLTLRLDADIIAWFKTHVRKGEGYQSNINRVLRDFVDSHSHPSR